MAVYLGNVNGNLLPPTITNDVFTKATEQSAVMRFAKRAPLSVSAATAIPVQLDVPQAGWVGEGGVKPVSEVGAGVKLMTGKKVALLVPISQEVEMTNPAGIVDQLQQDLPTALARAFDQAVISGTDPRSGGAGPFTEYLGLAPNVQSLGTAAQNAGGIYADLVTGAGKVVDKNYDFTGIVADPRLKIDAQLQVDTTGRPLFIGEDTGATVNGQADGSLAGYPVTFSKGVSGRYWRAGAKTQTATINGTPTGGTFVLSAAGNSTTLAYNAASSTVQTAIRAWGGIFANVTVGGSAGGPYTITFPDVNAVKEPAAPFTGNGAGLTGGTNMSVTIAQTGVTDSNFRGIGGDWGQCAYGVGMDITFKRSTEANYYDGSTWHSAFQENLVLYLVEAYYGFVVGDLNAFVIYKKGSATF